MNVRNKLEPFYFYVTEISKLSIYGTLFFKLLSRFPNGISICVAAITRLQVCCKKCHAIYMSRLA
jgi:hypothetical protein